MRSQFAAHWMLAGAFLMLAGTAMAHHGLAAFDIKSTITLKGTVTDFHFVNPHCVIEFDVKDDKGQVRSWQAELTSPLHLAPKGWTASSLEAGDQVTVSGHPAKNGAPSLWATRVIAGDGKELKIDSRPD